MKPISDCALSAIAWRQGNPLPLRLSMRIFVVALLTVASASPADAAEAARVEFDIVTDSKVGPDAVRDWYQLFSELKVRQADFHGARGAQALEIEAIGRGPSAYVVHGQLTARRELLVPGARFSLSDRGRLATWIQRLATDGPEALADNRSGAFGLPASTLDKLRRRLASPYHKSTAGRSPGEIADEIGDALDLEIIGSTAARSLLDRGEPLTDELQGLAVGTVLAATLRSSGLGYAPQRSDARLRVALLSVEPATEPPVEIWPVGWPADDRRRELVPKLFEFLNVEIDGISVGEAVANIAPRLEVPVLYDRVALARHDIDVNSVDAAIPAKRTSYSLLLNRLLFQAR
ncbi:MAG: hypothetical protein AB7U73_24775, partial [Pirellulales bacterium]